MNPDPLRVMVVDDTVTYRRILSDVIEGMGDAEVVASAPQGRLALARLAQGSVDLVLLDLEMPEMDGLEALGHIRKLYPNTSVVMISGETARAAEATIQALEQGALDFIRKPQGNDPEASRQELREALKPLLRHVRMRRNLRADPPAPPCPLPGIPSQPVGIPSLSGAAPSGKVPPPRFAPLPAHFEVLGVGVSTGGPNALGEFIPALPADFPLPVLLVQHMPAGFTASLAEHLAKRSALQVCEASEGDRIHPGKVYLAPGGRHMVVRKRPAQGSEPETLIVGINENPPENSCRPSVDVLFRSMAAHYEGGMLSVIMTGMGHDGCEGVRAMKRKGCFCLSQSAESCVVYGMPLAVDEAGLSDEQVPLSALAARVAHLARRSR